MQELHPFQLLLRLENRSVSESVPYLVAACGASLFLTPVKKDGCSPGPILSRWPEDDNDQDEGEPPQKKQKLTPASQNEHSISALTGAPDGRHIVTVSGSDKCLRVFDVTKGVLRLLTERYMPKRPCAIQITEDNWHILCADKFGDVYQLPLIPSPEWAPPPSNGNGSVEDKPKSYVPAATETTVHTQRNLRVLQEQLKSKGMTISPKEPLAFEHKIILGHVSMLTDLQLATTKFGDKLRHYIITSDRDEHIRVSRGIPQAHVIDKFCLGHKEFVHRLRVLPHRDLLVSGGGDDWMGVWDLTTGMLACKRDLRSIRRNLPEGDLQRTSPLAVRDIWLVHSDSGLECVVVGCEAISALAIFPVDNVMSEQLEPVVFDCTSIGQVLDLTDLGSGTLILSTEKKRLQMCSLEEIDGHFDVILDKEDHPSLKELNSLEIPAPSQQDRDALLRGVEKLRKRENEAEQDA